MSDYLNAAFDRIKFMNALQQSYTIDKTGFLSDKRSIFPTGGGLQKSGQGLPNSGKGLRHGPKRRRRPVIKEVMESYDAEEKAITKKEIKTDDVDIDPTVLQGETASAFGTAFTEIPTAEYDSGGEETSAIEKKVDNKDTTTKATGDVVSKIKSSDTYNVEYGKTQIQNQLYGSLTAGQQCYIRI